MNLFIIVGGIDDISPCLARLEEDTEPTPGDEPRHLDNDVCTFCPGSYFGIPIVQQQPLSDWSVGNSRTN
jgi:hypothetical protein